MIDYNALGCCIDDVYHNTVSDTKKVTSKLEGDVMTLTFMTVKQHARNMPMQHFMSEVKRESVEIFASKIKSIREIYKEKTGTSIKITPEKSDVTMPPLIETLTNTSLAEKLMYKVTCVQRYNIG